MGDTHRKLSNMFGNLDMIYTFTSAAFTLCRGTFHGSNLPLTDSVSINHISKIYRIVLPCL